MNGMISPVPGQRSRFFRFGNKGQLAAQSCRTGNTPKDEVPMWSCSVSFRILRVYFRKRVVRNLWILNHSRVLRGVQRDGSV